MIERKTCGYCHKTYIPTPLSIMASREGYCSTACLERGTKNPYETKKLTFPDEANLSPYRYKKEHGEKGGLLSEETAQEIKKHLKYGMSIKEISGKFGVPIGAVESIKYKRTWRHLE